MVWMPWPIEPFGDGFYTRTRAQMGKVWVLDTDTKGTGAEMVPLDRALKEKTRTREGERGPRVRRKPAPQPKPRQDDESAEPRGPRSFKVVNAITREVLGDGIGARETVELLDGMRSVVDAHIFVREPGTDEWRALTLREQRKLWGLRGR
jgi:hypothetical protein